jgi:hypothetical protein
MTGNLGRRKKKKVVSIFSIHVTFMDGEQRSKIE